MIVSVHGQAHQASRLAPVGISAVSTALEKVGLRVLDGHVNHCVSDAMRSGDPQAAEAKTQELLHAVERFARAR